MKFIACLNTNMKGKKVKTVMDEEMTTE